jgi:hypothetical protein
MTIGQPGGRVLRMRTNPPRPDESMKLTPARSMIRRCGFFLARYPRCSDKAPAVSMSISPWTVAMATPASQRSSMVKEGAFSKANVPSCGQVAAA